MARKTRKGSPAPNPGRVGRPPLAAYAAVGLACLALGSGGTYLALRPALTQASASRAVAAQAARDQGNLLEDQGQWPGAIAAYEQAIAGGLDNPDIRTDLGVAYFKANQPKKALEQYAEAQRQNPGHENSLYNQGIAYAVLGDTARAISVWRAYLQKFPQGQHVAGAQQLIAGIPAHGLTPAPAKP